ncbi:MAG: MMPL family transporter [candidate division Zixibacteria bacterium]|nr:MMPL family transporter [candidate division Zixibacteria bacterium]MDH3937025.1 MMPL family transporter [candidate division Zixibacteria bacterium]MDH4032171.1 MMPL family transporter [candidate division Zixibacteria bacterium]
MERLLDEILKRPALSLIGTLVLTLFLGFGLTRLQLRTDGAAIYPEENEIVARAETDRIAFNDPVQVILLVSARADGPILASPEGFRFIREIHEAVKRLPGVYGAGVHSPASLLDVRSNLETTVITTFFDSIPVDSSGFADLLTRFRQAPQVDGLYLSPDGRLSAMYLPLADSVDRRQVLASFDSWIQGYETAPFEMRLTGPVVAEASLGDTVLRDLSVLIPVMVVVVALMLLATLRTIGGLLIPLIEALLVLVWTLGLMGWVGAPVTLVTTVLPVILMTMAITDEIHLLQRLQAYMAGDRAKLDRKISGRQRLGLATLLALKDVGRPIVITSLTTSVGFLSFLTASMMPMRHFGLFTAFGITVAMILSFTFIPCLTILLPPAWFHRKVRHRKKKQPVHLMWMERLAANRSTTALVIGLISVGVCAPGLYLLTVQDSWVDNFDPHSALVSAERDFNDGFWGSYRLDVVFDGEPGFFYSSNGAAMMQRFTTDVLDGPHVGGVVSFLNPYREVALGLSETGDLHKLGDGTLQDIATVAEMTGDPSLMQLINEDGSSARAMVFVNSPNYKRSEDLSRFVTDLCAPLEQEYSVVTHSSGDIPVALEVVRSIVLNQMRSISWTLAGIALLLLVTFPRGVAALVAMVPVTATALTILSLMGYLGMPLGIATSMFASLTIGVGIDFALHFLHNYKRERTAGLDKQAALTATLETTGQAIRWNAVVLVLGIMALTFSALKPDRDLGILLAAAILTCYVMTLLFLPRLVKRLSLGLATLLLFLLPTGAFAGVSKADGLSAGEVMIELESDFRQQARLVKIEFVTTYDKRPDQPLGRTMFGLLDGDTVDTHLMYIVTEPPRMSGTTLLFADKADPEALDSTWIYLSFVKRVRLLDIRSARAMVPGTALSYEDARGFIPIDKYRFSFENDSVSATGEMIVVAEPLTDKIRSGVGFDRMILWIDRTRRIINRIHYLDAAGEIIKIYRIVDTVKVGSVWFPAAVTVRNNLNGTLSEARYRYWALDEPPSPDLFQASIAKGKFLNRLMPMMRRFGISLPPSRTKAAPSQGK